MNEKFNKVKVKAMEGLIINKIDITNFNKQKLFTYLKYLLEIQKYLLFINTTLIGKVKI